MDPYEIPDELKTELELRKAFILIGHEDPDGDCLSSQLAFGSFLKRQGKSVHLVSPGPFSRPEIAHQKKFFADHIPENLSDSNPLVIILDCSTLERIGYLAREITGFDIAVIDHHSAGQDFGDFLFIRPEAPSVTFLIYRIILTFNQVPTTEEAKLLLFGIVTDTGFFRHVESGSSDLFQAVAGLTAQGASPKDAFAEMYGGKTLESRQYAGTLLARATSEVKGKLIVTYETEGDLAAFGKKSKDSDAIYQQLQGIEGVEAIVLLRFNNPEEISVGLRSKLYADVGSLAGKYGGGGHKNAAGFTWRGPLTEIKSKLIQDFTRIL